MQFMGDLDSSNFKSITGTKLIGVGGNQGLESEKCKREHMWFLKKFYCEGGQGTGAIGRGVGVEPRKDGHVHDDYCDDSHYHRDHKDHHLLCS